MNAIAQTAQTLPAAADSQELEEQQQYLTFMLTGETYAIGILRIKEIIQYGQLTAVPRMPDFIRGVINLRGAVVPVIDLSARFGKQPTAVGRRNCIIIIEVALGVDPPKNEIHFSDEDKLIFTADLKGVITSISSTSSKIYGLANRNCRGRATASFVTRTCRRRPSNRYDIRPRPVAPGAIASKTAVKMAIINSSMLM